MVPTKGHKIINNHGTAPGAWFEQDGRCAVLMPGVPHEMKAMWEESVRPLLAARQNCTLHSLTLRVLGGESNIEQRVRHLLENENPTAAIYCKTGECEIRITARTATEQEGKEKCRAYAKKFYDILGDAVYDEDVAGIEETLVHILRERGLTVTTAESCTGGLIAQRLTDVSGASEVFGSGFVTYCEAAKCRMVGVQAQTIEQYNVVSAPVAAQMALGALDASGADIAVSVTGVAGPTGGDAVRPVGTVYIGAARGETVWVRKLFISRSSRSLVRMRAAQSALEMALRLAQEKQPQDAVSLAKAEQHTQAALDALNAVFVNG
jgi:nicotinamide-nucleotide amidase